MKRFFIAILISGALWAQAPVGPVQPTVTNEREQLKEKDAIIARQAALLVWRQTYIQLLQSKLQALASYYAVDDAVRKYEASEPKEPK